MSHSSSSTSTSAVDFLNEMSENLMFLNKILKIKNQSINILAHFLAF